MKLKHVGEIDFQRVHRLGGKKVNGQKNRDIIVRFVWYQDRMQVWNARRNLKGTQIYMMEDFPFEVEQRRMKLYPIFKEAMSKNMNVSLVADKLVLNGTRYTLDSLDKLPNDLKPESLSTRITDDYVLFYGQSSCFSTFYPASFNLDGKAFTGSEQYFQYNKAIQIGDNEIAAKILQTSDPAEQHRLGRRLQANEENWNSVLSEQLMEAANTAKFRQNTALKEKLRSTGNRLFVECNPYDKYWGVGLGIRDAITSNKNDWEGLNTFGKVLVKVRENLK